jgi:hypothetical protein
MKFFGAIFVCILSISYAFAWDRFEVVDDFSGEKSFGYIKKSSNAYGGFLILSCENKLKLEWASYYGSYANYLFSKSSGAFAAQPAAVAPAAALAPAAAPRADGRFNESILIRAGEDPVRREEWIFDNKQEAFSPENTSKFIIQIREKSILRFKYEPTNLIGVFDISNINQIAAKLKTSCY